MITNFLLATEFVQDGLFFDKNLNFVTLKEILDNEDKVVVFIFSFEEPMWKEDIKTIKKNIGNNLYLVCINIDKMGYKSDFVNDEVFTKNKITLIFDPAGVNVKSDIGVDSKICIVYKNFKFLPVKHYSMLKQYINKPLIETKEVAKQPSMINLLFSCGLKGMITSCPTCPDKSKTSNWEQREAYITAYKEKLKTYAFDLGNFLPSYPTRNEVKSIFYALLLTNYDGFLFGGNELFNMDKLLYYINRENLYDKFLFSQKWQFVSSNMIETYKQKNFSEFYTIECNNSKFLIIGLPPTTGHRYRIVVNTTDVDKIKQIILQQQPSGVILLSNMTYIDDIELAKKVPEIKLIVNANHNYKLPQLKKNYEVPVIFPVCSSEYITRVWLCINEDKIEDIKISMIPFLPDVKIKPELRKQLEKLVSVEN